MPQLGTATLSWTAPTKYVDGTPLPLSGIDGYLVYYGTESGNPQNLIAIVDPSTTRRTVTGLAPGTWYFTMTVVDVHGVESERSPIVRKIIH